MVCASVMMCPCSYAQGEYQDIDAEDTELSTAAAYLTEKGIMEGYEDGQFKPDKTVTRVEMAKMLYLADKDNAQKSDKTYIDIDESHWAYEYISNSSCFNGYEDNSFRPDNVILMTECMTVMVRAAGLKDAAEELEDRYPVNYMKVGMVYDLMPHGIGFNGNEETSRRNAAIMLYKALQSKK